MILIHVIVILLFLALLASIAVIVHFIRRKKTNKAEYEEIKKSAEQSAIISSLSEDYGFIGVIDVNKNETSPVHMSEAAKPIFEKIRSTGTGFDDIQQSLVKLVHPADREKFTHDAEPDVIKSALKKDGTYKIETRCKLHDRDEYIRIKFSTIKKDPTKVVVGLANIDAQVRQEEEEKEIETYKKAQAFTDSFLHSFISAYYVNLDDLTQITFHQSKTMAHKYGNVPNYLDAICDYINSSVHPDDRQKMLIAVTPDYIKKRFVKDDSFSIYMRDLSTGKVIWCRFDVTKGEDDHHAAFAFSDVTKKIEEDERKERSLSVLGELSESYEYIGYIDIEKNEISRYHASEMLKDLAENYLVEGSSSKTFDNIINSTITGENYKKFREETEREMLMERLRNEKYVDIITKGQVNGKEAYYQFRFAFDHNNAKGVILGLRDVSEEKQKQIELQEARDRAFASSNAKTAFLFNMSHDIRTPMNAIIGFTSMAKKNITDYFRVNDCLDKIDISSKQLLSLINQVLEMARIESGKIEIVQNTVDVEEAFESMVTIIQNQAEEKGLTFKSEMKNVKHNNVITDLTRMNQIILNIVSNAVKYTPQGGTVNFCVEEIESNDDLNARFLFTISDTGIGMSPEYIENIYEPFSREKNSTVSQIQGTGLGMAIVKEFVDLLGGEIRIDSNLGKGTTFEVEISFIISGANVSEKKAAKKIDVSVLKNRRVLLAEDNLYNREIANAILEENGLIVENAEDGDVAVEMVKKTVREKKYDYYSFVLMDIQMPKMDGFEATRLIRKMDFPQDRHLPIIAMTANAFEEDKRKALDAGMDAHLAKPVNIQLLLETLSKFID